MPPTPPRFWKRFVELRPDLIGTIIYFAPSKISNLPCVICEDGTISPVGSRLRFDSAAKLVDAWKKGDVKTVDGKKMPRRKNGLNYHMDWKDCFFRPQRKGSIYSVYDEWKSKQNGESMATRSLVDAQTNPAVMSSLIADSQRRLLNMARAKQNGVSVSYNLRRKLKDKPAVQAISNPAKKDVGKSKPSKSSPATNSGLLRVAKRTGTTDSGRTERTKKGTVTRMKSARMVQLRPDGIIRTNQMDTTTANRLASTVTSTRLISATSTAISGQSSVGTAAQAPSIVFVPSTTSQQMIVSSAEIPAEDSGLAILAEAAPLLLLPVPTVPLPPAAPMKKQCPGFDRRPFQEAITIRKWDSERMQFSPVVCIGDQAWSTTCEGEISEYRTLCWDCKQARQRLRRTNWDMRLQSIPNRRLSSEDMIKKLQILIKARNEALNELRKKTRENQSLKRELKLYRPDDVADREPVQMVVKKMNSEQRKLRSPVCKWVTDGAVCDYEAPSITLLNDHIAEEHIRPQAEMNAEKFPDERCYECNWLRCKRGEMERLVIFRRHVLAHCGSEDTEKNLERMRETLANLGRQPTGRRYERNRLMRESIDQVAHRSSRFEIAIDEVAQASSNLVLLG